MLSYLALGMIFFLIIVAAPVIVWLLSLPRNINSRRGHHILQAVDRANASG